MLSREELGIDTSELGGSAWTAALTSFFLFAFGAIIPVAPYLMLDGSRATLASIAASGVGLILIGVAISIFTGRSPLWSAARQLVLGFSAAAITYGVGRLIGVHS